MFDLNEEDIKDFIDNFSIIINLQNYLSPNAFSVLVRVFYSNTNDVNGIGNLEFQKLCNISKNTVTRTIDELATAGCVLVYRYPREVSDYFLSLEGCLEFLKEEREKERLSKENEQPFLRVSVDNRVRKLILERDLYRCLNCGNHKNLEIDHIVPVSKGGGNEIKNLQTLCASCNSNKGTKSMSEWLEE